jgi:hypothetical protein
MTTKYNPKGSGGGGNATELQGVPISATPPTNGQGLVYNGTSWIPAAASGNATEIQGNPVSGNIPTISQGLVWNGTTWIPSAVVNTISAPGAGITATTIAGSTILANTGVTSAVAGTGIGVSGATGAVTLNNTGVTGAVAGPGITVSAPIGNITIGLASAPGQQLATVSYGPAAQRVYTVGTVLTALDTTNVTLSFIVPASGRVLLTALGYVTIQSSIAAIGNNMNAIVAFQNHVGSTRITPQKVVLSFTTPETTFALATAVQLYYQGLWTGLTPGSSQQVDLATMYTFSGTAAGGCSIVADDGITGTNLGGPIILTAYAA